MTTSTRPPTDPVGPLSRLPGLVRATIGLLSGAFSVSVGHLVAAFVSPASSPFFAVADTVVRLSPPWLIEFGKSLGPVLDKLLLQVGVGVAVAALAVLAGLVSAQRPRPGLLLLAGLGGLGLLAVLAGSTFAAPDLLAPLAALVAAVASFAGLHGLAVRGYRDAGSDPALPRRRMLIGGSLAVGAAALAAGAGGVALLGGGIGDSRQQANRRLAAQPARPAPVIPAGADFTASGTPTFITSNADFYRIDTALQIPSPSPADWRLRIHGMVDRPVTLTYADLLDRPLVERIITMTCVSNPVGGDLISTATFTGVELRELLLAAGVRPGADQLFSTSVDGWSTGTPTDVVLEPDRGALLAVGMNGEALPPEHGFPVRMVVPGLYGFVSATKWITDIELTTFEAKQGYWLQRGWGQRAPIKTQSRIDSPRGFATVPVGPVTVAGIAWAQHTGIGAVQVRMDGGPWRDAELSTEVNRDTWRMWRTRFDVGPGKHTVQSRAIDRNGVVQPEARVDPIPDGATGWPATLFSAA